MSVPPNIRFSRTMRGGRSKSTTKLFDRNVRLFQNRLDGLRFKQPVHGNARVKTADFPLIFLRFSAIFREPEKNYFQALFGTFFIHRALSEL